MTNDSRKKFAARCVAVMEACADALGITPYDDGRIRRKLLQLIDADKLATIRRPVPVGYLREGDTSPGPISVTLTAKRFACVGAHGHTLFGRICIRYTPGKCIADSDSITTYLHDFRNRHFSPEACVATILQEFVGKLKPQRAHVSGVFVVDGVEHFVEAQL